MLLKHGLAGLTGGSAPFVMTDLGTDLRLWIDPSNLSTLYTDSDYSKATNATADGDAVYDIDDASGEGNHVKMIVDPVEYNTAAGKHWIQMGYSTFTDPQIQLLAEMANPRTAMEVHVAMASNYDGGLPLVASGVAGGAAAGSWKISTPANPTIYDTGADAPYYMTDGTVEGDYVTDGIDQTALEVAWDGNAGVVASMVNVNLAGGAYWTGATNGLWVFIGTLFGGHPDCQVYGMVITNVLTTQQRTDVIADLTARLP